MPMPARRRPRSLRLPLAAALLASFLAQHAARGQVDSSWALVLSAGGGYARYAAPHALGDEIARDGAAATVRLQWHPEHRFRVGVESGWTTMYTYQLRDVETSFGVTDVTLRLTAVPLLVVFSMPVGWDLELFAGTGWYLMHSHTTSFQSVADVSVFSQGWMLAGAWTLPLSRRCAVSVEGKWLGATEFEDAVLTLQAHAVWRLLEW